MTEYGPFTLHAVCPKCGSRNISASWKPYAKWGRHGVGADCDAPHPRAEHIDRHCRTCHYEWWEAPLDAMDTTKEADPWGNKGEAKC